jgi:hypothetical protein
VGHRRVAAEKVKQTTIDHVAHQAAGSRFLGSVVPMAGWLVSDARMLADVLPPICIPSAGGASSVWHGNVAVRPWGGGAAIATQLLPPYTHASKPPARAPAAAPLLLKLLITAP